MGDFNMKPIIGISSQYGYKLRKTLSEVNYTYVDAIVQSGGIPVIIPVLKEMKDINRYIDMIDGLILTGGEDISPLRFEEEPIKETKNICYDRDETEITLFNEAYSNGIPVLGVCRGLQVLNVALDGTLYQDINTQIPNSMGHISTYNIDGGYHSINIKKNTILHDIFKEEKINVNSQHHQSIKDLGKGLKTNSISSDGVIEGAESTTDNFVLGTQFHPEAMLNKHGEFLNLFNYFINKCK